MGTVTIGGNPYDIYGTLAAADIYLAARLDAATWSSATTNTKSQALVTATRLVQSYLLSRGFEVDPATTVDDAIANATYEMAFGLVAGTVSADTVLSASAAKKRVKAGSAEVEYFASQSTLNASTGMPSIVLALISGWIKAQGGGAGAGIGIPFASGTGNCSTLIPNGSQIGGSTGVDCGCD